MACSNLSGLLDGGNGCGTSARTSGWLKELSDKVCLLKTSLNTKIDLIIVAIGKKQITCSPLEYVTLNPPSGSTCNQYLQSFISTAGGYIANPDATSACQYCSFRTTDEFLATSFSIFYSHHWRNTGIFIAFTGINVSKKISCILFTH